MTHLAVDIGSASGRMLAGSIEDGRLKTREIHRFETGDMFLNGARVRNIYRWYEEMLIGLKKYVGACGGRLTSIGVDAMGEDFVLLDRRGGFLGMPPSYRDFPEDRDVVALEERAFGNERLYGVCANQTVANDTLRQLIALTLDEGRAIAQAHGLLFLGDAFHYMLCGRRATEFSLASYGKLIDQATGTWSPEIFDAFSIPRRLMMPIVHCGDKLGAVYRAICDDAGLENQPDVIAPSVHDSACAAFTVPVREGTAFISSGSWSIVGMVTDRPVINREAWRFNCANSGMPMRANMFKKLVAGMWIIQRCRKEWALSDFSEIVRMAEGVADNRLTIDPDAAEFFNPASMTRAIAGAVRRDFGADVPPGDAARITRIWIESLALKYRYTVERLKRISRLPVGQLFIVGGGSRNRLLNQFTADACGVPVLTGITEASAIGNLLTQMIGSGAVRDEAEAHQIIRNTFAIERFEPRDGALWAEKYRAYQGAHGLDGAE